MKIMKYLFLSLYRQRERESQLIKTLFLINFRLIETPFATFYCSGITLTKLVGVLVLCFSRTEVFVVFLNTSTLTDFIHHFVLLVMSYFSLEGLLFQNVSCFGASWFLARASLFTCKILNTLFIDFINELSYIICFRRIFRAFRRSQYMKYFFCT